MREEFGEKGEEDRRREKVVVAAVESRSRWSNMVIIATGVMSLCICCCG